MNKPIQTRLKLIGVMVVITLALAGCGGGGGSSTPTPELITLKGVVADDRISNAEVSVVSLSNGAVIGTGTTDTNGAFSINVPPSSINSAGLKVVSNGGNMNGVPFSGQLAAIYPKTADSAALHVNLHTTALTTSALSASSLSGSVLEKHEILKAVAINSGLMGTDYNLPEPTGTNYANLQKTVAAIGLNAALDPMVNLLNATKACSNSVGANCQQMDFGVTGLATDTTISTPLATLSIPANALFNCRVTVLDRGTGSLVSIGEIPSNSTTTVVLEGNRLCRTVATKRLTLKLGEATPAATMCADDPVKGIEQCITSNAGFTKHNFATDQGETFRVRSTSGYSFTPVTGNTVTLGKSYGANLFSSEAPRSQGLATNQWQGKQAIIYVHGFTQSGFGGDSSTWENLPQLIAANADVVSLNFRWQTRDSFYDAAQELANAVDYAYDSTGKKVYIVAHSFGGVLSRVMLQDIGTSLSYPSRRNSAALVAKLVTVGTPHSGTSTSQKSIEGVNLPVGWGLLEGVKAGGLCWQLTCYQTGTGSIGTADKTLQTIAESGTVPPAGYVTARIASKKGNLPAGLKVLALMGTLVKPGLKQEPNTPHSFDNGDGLISYLGQRFVPGTNYEEGSNNNKPRDLLNEAPIGGASVTERILGLPVNVNVLPGDQVDGSQVSETFSSTGYGYGYRHSPALDLWGLGVPGIDEVAITNTNGCGTAITCQHDAYLNIRDFFFTAAQIQASTSSYTALKDIQLWATNLLSSVKSVVFSFASDVANFATKTVNAVNGVSATITGYFTQSGAQTITATLKDGDNGTGNTLGSTTLSITVAPAPALTSPGLTSAAVQSDGRVKVVGTAQARVAVKVTWPDNTTLTTTSDNNGDWSISTASAHTEYAGRNVSAVTYNNTTTSTSVSAVIAAYSTPSAVTKLTDTGITANQCYGAGSDILISCTSVAATSLNSQQDGMVGRDVSNPDNSDGKLGFSYSLVPRAGGGNYDKTECVKDNITGLMWEGKPASGTRGNPALNPNGYYTNYAMGYNDGYGNPVTLNASTNAQGYVNAVNAAGLCAYTDWRLPTASELQSLVDYGVASPGPTIDGNWFPNTQGNWYWSSSRYVSYLGYAWSVDFSDGYVDVNYDLRYHRSNDNNYVRLVR